MKTGHIVSSDECVDAMIVPSQWVFSLIEIILGTLGLVFNTIIIIITHNSVPMPFSQRRILSSISINFSFISGFQLARNFFQFLVIQQPCLNQVTTASCKLIEFPLLFGYIHCAFAFFLLGLQANFLKIKPSDKRPIVWYMSCSVWQTTVAAFCVTITLLFTAFDQDLENAPMSKCSILLAVHQSYLTFGMLTIMIILHLSGFLFIYLASWFQENKKSWIAFTIFSLKEVMQFETLAWQICLFFSGCVVLYRHVFRDICDECAIIILEISFTIIPLIISFLHPLFLLWFVLPVRDAATKKFPCILAALPEYSLIPPHVPSASTSTNLPLRSPPTETTVSNENIDVESKPSTSGLKPPVVIVDSSEWDY